MTVLKRPSRRYDYIDSGAAIYVDSFATIRRETALEGMPPGAATVAVRMVHGTGQTDLVDDLVIHPDLVGRDRWVAIEGDSWTWHSTRKAHGRDCARYNLLVVDGWRVLRFTWEPVMLEQPYVRWVLGQVVRPVGQDQATAVQHVPS